MDKKKIMPGILGVGVLVLLYWGRKSSFFTVGGDAYKRVPSVESAPATAKLRKAVGPSVPSTAQQPKPDANILKRGVEEAKIWNALIATPILFFGKVVDEMDNPIPSADVHASFSDKVWENGSVKNLKTDAFGLFHASGHGLGITIQVSKQGYYHLKGSDGVFQYAQFGGRPEPHADSGSPAIFILKKMGNAVPLVHIERYIRMKKDGTPTELSLLTGGKSSDDGSSIRVEAWTQNEGIRPNSNTHFDWRCRISVPGGGLLVRNGEFDFTAPAGDYTPFQEIDMPASRGEAWSSHVSRQFFVKLADDRYARIQFQMIAGGDHFFAVNSYLNPNVGDHNLEADPTKSIVPPKK